MKSYSQFLEEDVKLEKGELPQELDFNINPRDITADKGLSGKVTAHISSPIKIKIEKLLKIPGAAGEEKDRLSAKTAQGSLLDQIIKKPKNFTKVVHPITIGVNKDGKAYIMDGNHRLGFAKRHNLDYLKAVVKYYEGGEDAKGPFSPKKLLK
jgi:hypothetical protein